MAEKIATWFSLVKKNKYLTHIQIPREPRTEIQNISSNSKRVQNSLLKSKELFKSKRVKIIYSNPKISK